MPREFILPFSREKCLSKFSYLSPHDIEKKKKMKSLTATCLNSHHIYIVDSITHRSFVSRNQPNREGIQTKKILLLVIDKQFQFSKQLKFTFAIIRNSQTEHIETLSAVQREIQTAIK
jgi:hypothetical protein